VKFWGRGGLPVGSGSGNASGRAWVGGPCGESSRSDRVVGGQPAERERKPGVRAGGLLLSELNADSVPAHPEIFEKAIRKLRGRQMPPPDTPQPSQPEIDALVGWLESTLDKGSIADIVVWSGDPLELMTRAETVIIGGVVQPLVTHQTRLRDRYRTLPSK